MRGIVELDEIRVLMAQQLALSRDLRARIRELEAERHAPLAVVGTALRLPGGLATPQQYWDFLLGDRDVRSAIPEDRPGLRSAYDARPDRPDTSYVDRAGFLDGVADFDPDFFGIGQREADALDPQQRLLLETAWEAMERAGIPIRRQERLSAGVFVGLMTSDYTARLAGRDDRGGIDPYYGTGGGHAMAAGRVAYALGLSGPAMTVDTACSSSLVALHTAAQSLRRGECRYALAGGANVFFSPDLMVSLCRGGALARDGRCKTFLDAADGYGRGEGAGMVVLMRLADAEAEGRPVLAVLRGSAVNHDGASSGLTVPNGPAQQEVLRAALADAGVAPEEVGYVEAHGTGTALGDPVEAGALDAVYGSGAPGRRSPLAVGSVKSRIGHLESAAGVAALVKVVLMLRHGRIPASATDADGPLNHLIPWDRVRLTVPRRTEEWPAGGARRIAGVSAFGMSGTNAHVLLESYTPPPTAGPARPAAVELLTLSARHPDSLRALADATASHLRGTAPDRLAAVCATLRDGRAAFEHRIAVTGHDPQQLADRLHAAASAYDAPPAGTAAPAVRLRFGPDPAALERGLAALHDAFPGTADAEPAPPGGPRAGVRELLRRFGVRAAEEAAAAGCAAEVECGGAVFPLLTGDPGRGPHLLADLLAALFRSGADLRLDGLRAPGTRYADDLPVYAFRRRRCWIDEPSAVPSERSAAEEPEQPPAVPGGRSGREEVTALLFAELRSVMRADEDPDPALTFLDAGGDSFTAMQLTIAVERHFRIELPVEEFVVDLPLAELFGRLADFIVRNRPDGIERKSGT